MSGKKTKTHKMVDGRLLQMNKQFSNLKMKQRDKITRWVYEEYKKYYLREERIPDRNGDEQIVSAVFQKIYDDDIWIPDDEIYAYYHRKNLIYKPDLKMKESRSSKDMFLFIKVLLTRTGVRW